jgi:hypothetical protein
MRTRVRRSAGSPSASTSPPVAYAPPTGPDGPAPGTSGELAPADEGSPDEGSPDEGSPGEGSWDAAGLDAILSRLAATSTRAELAAIAATEPEQRAAYTFLAETARALHLLLSAATTEGQASVVGPLRRVTRMLEWLARRAQREPHVRDACELATGVFAELHAAALGAHS